MSASTDVRTVPVHDGHLAYLDVGTGRPVVLLHGGVLDHRMWAPQVDTLVAAGYRVVVPDARGHGASSTPTAPFRHCDDLAALLGELDTGPVTLVGISMGAGTAVDTAVDHPELVRALVVSGTGTSAPDWRDPWVLGVFATWARTQATMDLEGWLDAFLSFLPGPHRSLDELDAALVEPMRVQARETLLNHVPKGDPVLPSAVDDVTERSRSIAVPVLALPGGLDADDHIRLARELVERVPAGTVTTIEGAAHYPNLERPERFDSPLLEFLART